MDRAEKNNQTRRNKRKVHYAFARRSEKYIIHPAIRIGGRYLTALGFNIGDEIEITCEKHRIVIRKIIPDGSAARVQKPDAS